MGKSQNTLLLAAGMNGKRVATPGFFLGRCPAAHCGVLHWGLASQKARGFTMASQQGLEHGFWVTLRRWTYPCVSGQIDCRDLEYPSRDRM